MNAVDAAEWLKPSANSGLMRRCGDEDLEVMDTDENGRLVRLDAALLGWSRHDRDHAAELATPDWQAPTGSDTF